jgi:hypothetical protein
VPPLQALPPRTPAPLPPLPESHARSHARRPDKPPPLLPSRLSPLQALPPRTPVLPLQALPPRTPAPLPLLPLPSSPPLLPSRLPPLQALPPRTHVLPLQALSPRTPALPPQARPPRPPPPPPQARPPQPPPHRPHLQALGPILSFRGGQPCDGISRSECPATQTTTVSNRFRGCKTGPTTNESRASAHLDSGR